MGITDEVSPTQNVNGVVIVDEKKDAGRSDSSSALEAGTLEPRSIEDVDPAAEQAIFNKLDKRIVPTVMWCYLMNMMDRGMTSTLFDSLSPSSFLRRANCSASQSTSVTLACSAWRMISACQATSSSSPSPSSSSPTAYVSTPFPNDPLHSLSHLEAPR